MADAQTRVQRTVRFDSDVDDRVVALAREQERSLEAQYRFLVNAGLRAQQLNSTLSQNDAQAS